MDTGPAPAVASLFLSATSIWLLRVVSELHWGVVFVPGAPWNPVTGRLLAVGYRLLAFAAVAFNLWALARGRPRWPGLVALPLTLMAFGAAFMIQ